MSEELPAICTSSYWDSQEYKEFNEWSKKRVAELDEWFNTHPLSEVKTMKDNGIYWHLQIERCCLRDLGREHSLAYYYVQQMRICVECMKHSKTISEEAFKKWAEYWGCFVLDTGGEAHCKLNHQYYPQWGLDAGESKEEWEEILELQDKYYNLKYPNGVHMS